MYEIFGNFDSVEELNACAEGLLAAGDAEKLMNQDGSGAATAEGLGALGRQIKEYCPDEEADLVETDSEEPETAAGSPYRTRAEYIQSLPVEEHARYMANAMLTKFVGLTFRQLTEEGFWKNWLMCLVDETGRDIEEG